MGEARDSEGRTAADAPSTVRRLWALPRWAHALALAAVLLVGLAASGPGVPYTSDEGAALLQARLLGETGSWQYEHPLAELDPEGTARPFVRGDVGTEGMAPYVKHPAYPVLLLGADEVGGVTAMLVLSVAGTVGAALAAAALAARFDPRLDTASLWIAGLASPLLWDAYVVLGHTLAAAAVGFAAWAALRATERHGWTRALWVVTAGAAVTAGSMVRTEALLAGPALALGLGAGALVARRREGEPLSGTLGRWGAPAVAVLAGAAVARAVDTVAARAIIGTSVRPPGIQRDESSSWLAGRAESVVATWLDPSYHGARSDTLLMAGLALLAVAAVAWRSGSERVASGAAVAAAAAYVVGLGLAPSGAVPGLLVAFPVLVVAAILATRDLVATPARAAVVAAGSGLVLGVLATQYARGGGVEWGGRYFAVALPLLVPAAVASLAGAQRRSRRPARSAVVLVALGVIAVALSWTALDAHRSVHASTEGLLAAVRAASAEAGAAPPFGRPVVVSDNRLLPQILYPAFDEVDWLVARRSELGRSLDRLADAGASEVVLVAPDAGELVEGTTDWQAVGTVDGPEGVALDVVVLERTG